ncbi:LytTR family DNA-binding domain-containing protein [Persicobacter psychrovividus]|uniref:DNA-binding response regulator n=1 Tax=Persicobacter psychrovividus TaxID=387638 RepID=A0ABN6LB29_9BACT|nr:DNA-binding response regulator [Persicobacter psychrovividus]
MQKLKCLIVDDELLARMLLKDYVSKVPNLELIDTCESPLEAIELLKSTDIDLLFLDIQMPDLTGFELLNALAKPPMVIFTTAYAEHAVKGFEVQAIDYLLKPFSLDRFMKAVAKAEELMSLKEVAPTTTPAATEDFLMIKEDYKYHRINVSDIAYVEGMREYVRYHTPTMKVMALQSLTKLMDKLPQGKFMRVHKSFIVNMDFVEGLDGNQLKILEQYVPIGKTYKEAVLHRLGL